MGCGYFSRVVHAGDELLCGDLHVDLVGLEEVVVVVSLRWETGGGFGDLVLIREQAVELWRLGIHLLKADASG